jgi:hypothetical protein
MLIFGQVFFLVLCFMPASPLKANPQALPKEDGDNKKITFTKISCNTKIQDTVSCCL